MLVVCVLLTPLLYACANTEILFEEQRLSENFTIIRSCLDRIIKTNNIKELTYNNTNEDNELLLKEIYSMNVAVVSLGAVPNTLDTNNRAYFMYLNVIDQNVFNNLTYLMHEEFWKPELKFMIVVKRLEESHLRNIFDVLLKLHIHNVVVINGTNTTELYSYNAFENNACGNYYTRIIEHGTCNQKYENLNLYPEKKTSLKSCNFRVTVPIIPNLTRANTTIIRSSKIIFRIEEYVFNLMSEAAGFKYSWNIRNIHEEFGFLHRNISMPAALTMLQENTTDIIIASLYLTIPRSKRFAFIHGYLDYVDDLRIFVKRTEKLPPWKDFYLEFTPLLWTLLFIILFLFSIIITLVLKPTDKGSVVMVLVDNLLQHGAKFKKKTKADGLLITWVWFVYLVSCFYTCSLVSLTTKPNFGYQIKTLDDLKLYNIKPCFSILVAELGNDIFGDIGLGTNDPTPGMGFYDALTKVSKSYKLFTIVSQFAYWKYENFFLDEYGYPLIYMFDETRYKTIYSFYLNKGFPMTDRLNILVLRAIESGLVTRRVREMKNSHRLQFNTNFKEYKSRFVMPWLLFCCGVATSCVAFLVEIVFNRLRGK